MSLKPCYSHRVVYADTDAGGVMYHGRYFDLAERSRNEALAAQGALLSRIQIDHDLVFVVNRVSAQFFRPAVLDDKLFVASSVLKCTPARIVWETEVIRANDLLTRLVIHTAGVRWSTRQLTVISEEILFKFHSLSQLKPKENI